jgi:molybdopterin-guanine dinucleotide biosynthesis protein A
MLIERVGETLSPLCSEILVITSEEQYDTIATLNLNVRVVVDLYPASSVRGIYTGLASSSTSHAVAVACDMPFLNGGLLRYLIDLINDFDTVVPVVDDFTNLYTRCIPEHVCLTLSNCLIQ